MGFVEASYHYTAPGHGKSSADAIGGTIKELCNRLVAHGENITTAQSLYEAIKRCSKVLAFLITEEHNRAITTLLPSPLNAVKNAKQVYQVHYVRNESPELTSRSLSYIDCGKRCIHFDLPGSVSKFVPLFVGDWVIVIYEKQWYPGPILSIDDANLITVKFLMRSKKSCTWPRFSTDDIQKLFLSQILMTIDKPTEKKQISNNF